MENRKTTILVSQETRNQLKQLVRSMDETYDDVIQRLIKECKTK